MHYRSLKRSDAFKYCEDLLKCYQDNRLIMDCQNPISIDTERRATEFILGYIEGKDSIVVGIFDDRETYLYGIVIFDNIRNVDKFVSEVHIAITRELWGRKVKSILDDMLDKCLFDVIYCTIPQIAVNAIAMVRRMKFKKTGYIPCALPYINSKGEEKLYDLNIFCYRKDV